MATIRPSIHASAYAAISHRKEDRRYCKAPLNPNQYKRTMDPGIVWRENIWPDGRRTRSAWNGNFFKKNEGHAYPTEMLQVWNNLEMIRVLNGLSKSEFGRILGYGHNGECYGATLRMVMKGIVKCTPLPRKLTIVHEKFGISRDKLHYTDLATCAVVKKGEFLSYD